MTHRLRTLFALAMLLALPARASFVDGGKREFPIACNGVPCVIDSANSTIYVSMLPTKDDSVKLVFSSGSVPYLRINYKRYNMGDTCTLVNNMNRTYRVMFGPSIKTITLRLTTLPIVMIEASHYEHDVYHHGYLNIIDPWKRTKKSALFRHFVGVRIRGGYTAGLEKKPYAIKLWDDNRGSDNVKVMGMMKDDNLILDAMFNDKARMRTRLCFDLWNRVDSLPYEVSEGHSLLNGTVGHYVEVFVDGSYNGLYCLTDKINRKKLDLLKTETDTATGKLVYHGLIYKATGWSNETKFNNLNTSASTDKLYWQEWEQKYPDDSTEQAHWGPLKDLIMFTTPATNSSGSIFSSQLRRRYYMQNLTDYVLFINLLHINDNNCKNTYVSFRDASLKIPQALLTPWDLDASIGRNWDGGKLEGYGFDDKMVGGCGLFKRALEDGPYYLRRNFSITWKRWKEGVFSLDSVRSRIEAYRDLLINSGAWSRETSRWPGTTETIYTETNYMISWYKGSMANAEKYFADFPSAIGQVSAGSDEGVRISVSGHRVMVASAAGSAEVGVFTTNGSLIAAFSGGASSGSEELPRGIYIVRVTTPRGTASAKVAVR